MHQLEAAFEPLSEAACERLRELLVEHIAQSIVRQITQEEVCHAQGGLLLPGEHPKG